MIRTFGQQSATAESEPQAEGILRHLLAHTLCTQRHTITGLLTTAGLQDRDWTAAYRLYTRSGAEPALLDPVRDGVLAELAPGAPLVVAVDDSTMHKSGTHIPGAGWHRDALGPPFHTNLIYAQKFIQFSAAIPDPANPKRARLIPIAFELIPKRPKLAKEATEEQRLLYAQEQEHNRPGAHAARMLQRLRTALDAQHPSRPLYLCGDGHYSTTTLLQDLPARCFYIGRIRGDTHLCAPAPPPPAGHRGRTPAYGEKLPTPDQLRRDKTVAWQSLTLEQGGQTLTAHFKHIANARWHAAGEKQLVQVIVLRARRYRLKQNGPWRYTQPAYLLTTDPALAVKDFIQFYCWRWDIEVNFRDEKQLFGLGQAQVRNPNSVERAPALCIAAYAGLLLAAVRVFGFDRLPLRLTAPKWYPDKRKPRISTADLLRQLRHEAAARSLRLAHFCDFSLPRTAEDKPEKCPAPRPTEDLEAAM